MDLQDAPVGAQMSPLTKFLIRIAGADEETLRSCPSRDWGNVRAVAQLMIATWLYQAGLMSIIAHRLFAAPGEVRPDLVLAAMFIATFILLFDSYSVMRSGWQLSGIAELKRGGLDISGGPMARIKAGLFLVIRIVLSIGIAQLTAIFLSLLVFGADISARLQSDYQQANARLIARATALVDGDIQRATEAVTAASGRVSALSSQVSALRQNQIDPSVNNPQMQSAQQEVTQLIAQKAKADDEVTGAQTFEANELAGIKGAPGNSGHAGNGLRHKAAAQQVANARTHARDLASALDAARTRLDALRSRLASADDVTKAQSHEQLPAFESSLTTENARLASLNGQLADLTRGRGDAIRALVENTPDHVGLDHGLLAQITALEAIAQSDQKITAVIILIDVTSFGFELAAVLAKITSFVPTTYSAMLARDTYMEAVRIVDEMTDELGSDRIEEENAPETPSASGPANDNRQGMAADFASGIFGGFDDHPPQPPKRPRGRPRKTTLN